jgi:5'-nucleotidase
MRILVTNDDGIFAPGIRAIATGLYAAFGDEHELVIVSPLTDHSGAGAAVGPVYERESIPYEHVEIPGLPGVPSFGVDGSPALCVILAGIEGFGGRPDLIVSGINHGVNAGRSALHSGTVGATLTGAQFGISGLAVSIAWSDEASYWQTAVDLACAMVPTLAASPAPTVLNLNVPAVAPGDLKGLRHGRLGKAGLIRRARPEHAPLPASHPPTDRTGGAIVLTMRGMSSDAERIAELAELEPDSDNALIEEGFASVTALVGVREDVSDAGVEALDGAIAAGRAVTG